MIPLPTNLLPYWYFPWNTDTWVGYTPFIFHRELLAVDALRQIFIWKDFAFFSLKSGIWPLWNPYNFAGQPLLANFQTSVFYPLSWFYFIFSSITAWSIYIYSQPILAALWMYLFLKEKSGNRFSSFLGSLMWIFSSFLSTRYFWGVYVHSILWVPLGLLLVEKFIKNKISNVKFILLATIVFSLLILGGYPQFALFSMILIFAYFFFKAGWRSVHLPIFSAIIAILICGIQLVPTAELYRNSLRESSAAAQTISDSLLTPKYLASIVNPDYWGSPGTNNYIGGKDYSGMNGYFGIVALVFCLYSIFYFRNRAEIRFWIGVMLASLLLAYKNPLAYMPLYLKVPILSSGGAWNSLFFLQIAGVILASYGLNEAVLNKSKKVLVPIIIIFIILLLLLLFGFNSPTSIRTTILIISGLAMLGFFIFTPKMVMKMGILFLVCVSGVYYLWKVTPFGEMNFLYPRHPIVKFLQNEAGYSRYIGFGKATISSNFSTYFKIYGVDGYDSLWPRWYGELLSSTPQGVVPNKVDRADVSLSSVDNKNRDKLMSLLGIRYILDQSDDPRGDRGHNVNKFPKDKYSLLKQWGILSVYEYKNVYPRTFLAKSCLVVPKEVVVETLFQDSMDLHEAVVLSDYEGSCEFTSGSSEILSYNPNEVVIATHTSGKGLLFLSDNYFPGWKVTVNSIPMKIYQADYSFRAVLVPKGDSKVHFYYEPESFRIGKWVSIFGVSLWLFLLIYSVFSRRTIKV